GEPFHRCTHTALSPKGEIYVSDGYGNARVHKYSPAGKLLFSWGEPGTDPGQFNIVHNICTDADGWVYVADRENHRVQVFDGNGKYQAQWNNLHRPCGICMPYTHKPERYSGEPAASATGRVLTRPGRRRGRRPRARRPPHRRPRMGAPTARFLGRRRSLCHLLCRMVRICRRSRWSWAAPARARAAMPSVWS